MAEERPVVLVTGAAGNLGLRLLEQLSDFSVVGVDMRAPITSIPLRFEPLDLGDESSCRGLVELLRSSRAAAIIHLAFVIDPVRTGVLERDRMWQINVAGTARVLEAIAEVNRMGGNVTRFIYPSSVSAYGSETPGPVKEDYPLGGHTLTYAVHKAEADNVVQERAETLGGCRSFILRPHIFTGATMQNYLVGALRGTPTGKGKLAEKMRARGKRLPMLLPMGQEYLEKKFQFVHVDDVARLIVNILKRPLPDEQVTILNVAGRGEPVTIEQCARLAGTKMARLPGKALCRAALKLMWDLGISAVPPDALPYIIGSYTMDCSRLQKFLGSEYERVIRYTVEEALADSFKSQPVPEPAPAGAAG